MFTLIKYFDNAIADIHFYYNNKQKISKLKECMNKHPERKSELNDKIWDIQGKINTELFGEYKVLYQYFVEDGKIISRRVKKKVRNGKLENLIDFISESSERKAINKFLLKNGGKKNTYTDELMNPEYFYSGKDEYDLENAL